MQKMTSLVNDFYSLKSDKSIWRYSKWSHIEKICINDIGKIGELFISNLLDNSNIVSNINGKCGNIGDGTIKLKTVEIKTARLNSNFKTFQHELGEFPWKSDYMIFIDICPDKVFITIFPNFSQEFYKKSGKYSKIKCSPVFPARSICWRKLSGNFKLDTDVKTNEANREYTYILDKNHNNLLFKKFVDRIIN
jgi:hypothetical protein